MKYQLATFRAAGLEARRTGDGRIAVRNPKAVAKHQRETYWRVSPDMWKAMQKDGIVEAFTNYTLLGDLFSI